MHAKAAVGMSAFGGKADESRKAALHARGSRARMIADTPGLTCLARWTHFYVLKKYLAAGKTSMTWATRASDETEKIYNRAGWKDDYYFYVAGDVWRREVHAGSDGKRGAQHLLNGGYLVRGDGQNLPTRMPSSVQGGPRANKIRASILGAEDAVACLKSHSNRSDESDNVEIVDSIPSDEPTHALGRSDQQSRSETTSPGCPTDPPFPGTEKVPQNRAVRTVRVVRDKTAGMILKTMMPGNSGRWSQKPLRQTVKPPSKRHQ